MFINDEKRSLMMKKVINDEKWSLIMKNDH